MLQLPCSKNTFHQGIETRPPHPGYTRRYQKYSKSFFGFGGRLPGDPSGRRAGRVCLLTLILLGLGLLSLRLFAFGFRGLLQDCPGNSAD